ncbi:MAG: tetratricopeptide repeat protein [Deltaproteobacteria bacterium]|nr:tetratricopeptide repeat protein [Deltaproteobacteria bacterium]
MLSQVPHGKSPTDDYPRLLLALCDAAPGALIFVQLNSPVQRRQLPEKLAADGLKRPFAVADFATFQLGPPPDGVLREFLEEVKSTLPEILFVDGLEHWVEADPKTLDTLNLGRERLVNLGMVVVFLLPVYLIDQIRTQALNLWSWRAHYYSLEPNDYTIEEKAVILSRDAGHTIAPGDTPEARDRRIRILRRLLTERLAEHRTIESLMHPLLLPLVWELYDAGRFTEALTELDQAKASLEKIKDSLDNVAILHARALVLQALHYFEEADSLYQHALTIAMRNLGSEHPNVVNILNNLGTLRYDEHKYAEAESLYLQALAIREKILGQEHRDVASSLNNLALLYESQGRYGEALSLYQKILAILQKTSGPGHPDVALSLNNLASFCHIQGKYSEAARYYQRALAIWEKTLGSEHPYVTTVLENYADLLRATNRETEAAQLEARAKAIRAKHAQGNPAK